MTALAEAAAWHEQQLANMRRDYEVLKGLGVPLGQHRVQKMALHERFAIAIREADTDEPTLDPKPETRNQELLTLTPSTP